MLKGTGLWRIVENSINGIDRYLSETRLVGFLAVVLTPRIIPGMRYLYIKKKVVLIPQWT